MSREEWAKPRGRKSHQRRCGSDDRGEAGLRPDQAINEATCVRVLNHNLTEKRGYLGFDEQEVGTLQRGKRNNLLQKAASSPKDRSRLTRLRRGCVGQAGYRSLIEGFRGGLPRPRPGFDHPPFTAPICAYLFDDEGGKRSSFEACGRKNRLGQVLHHPTRL